MRTQPRIAVLLSVLVFVLATARYAGAQTAGEPGGPVVFATDPSDLKPWLSAFQTAVSQLRAVTWRVVWDDLGVAGPSAISPAANPALSGREHWMHTYQGCVNAKFDGMRPSSAYRMGWADVLTNDVTKGVIKVAGSWWSNHLVPAAMTTAVTSSSMNRLQQLYAQCKTWSGPLSIVLYQALFPLGAEDNDEGKLSPGNQAKLRTAVLQVGGCGCVRVARWREMGGSSSQGPSIT
jgi:hypothetical protein